MSGIVFFGGGRWGFDGECFFEGICKLGASCADSGVELWLVGGEMGFQTSPWWGAALVYFTVLWQGGEQ